MAVVTITAILAVLGLAGFSRYMAASRGSEAVAVIQVLRSASESYIAENHIYLNVSSASGGTLWYPRATPDKQRAAWSSSSHLDYARWRALGPAVNQSVMFSYLLNAGVPGTIIPALQVSNGPALTAAQPLDWYVIQAKGDVNGNSVFARYASTSMTGEIYTENEGE